MTEGRGVSTSLTPIVRTVNGGSNSDRAQRSLL